MSSKDNTNKLWDATDNVEYVFINESLFNFHLLGFISISDGGNWLEKLPINSNSYIVMDFSSQGSNDISLTFRVTCVSDIAKKDISNKRYNIQFVSPEAVDNFNVRISKGYAGPSSAIVRDVLSKITSKNMLVTKMEDDAKLLAPNMHPYKVIDLLNLYGSKNCYDFMFWENFRGLNYNRITELLNRPITSELYEKDLENASEPEIIKNPDYMDDKTNIFKYYQSNQEDLIVSLREGELGNSTYTYNSLNGMPYQYNVNNVCKDNIVYHFNEDTLNYQNYGSRHKMLNELIRNEILVVTNGDYNRCTGDMCFVKMAGRSQDAEYTSSLSGNFLIMRIQHEFTLAGYKQTLGLSR
jgi:hypothetical protein